MVGSLYAHQIYYSIFFMSKIIQAYRELYRKIGRLPLDVKSISLFKQSLRHEFSSKRSFHKYAGVDPKKYTSIVSLLDDILVYRKYKRIPELLDGIYKRKIPSPSWATEFFSTKYSAWKPFWPHVHLIYEFGNEKSISVYRKELSRMEPENSFSLMKELALSLPKNDIPLTPLPRRTSSSRPMAELLKKVQEFHAFISKHANILSDVKIYPLEIHFEPSRLGLPLSIAAREKKLRDKVSYAKHLLRTYKPLDKEDLDHLICIATAKDTDQHHTINDNFRRYMLRVSKSRAVSPYEKKYVWQKRLIPNERNIRFYYRQYVMGQFYVDNAGNYQMSPAKNFYD
ncbi:hypothetical protein FOB63_000678 [Clavispora lusitaniae]|uniref:uncharacterized protein n=1 Tax=Clavispora lusitaniae TaxID=36911 RepID=UPI00202C9BA3|nr:hypothetical protein FOB63_000678 [Clavispora lusitaniae]